MGKAMKIFLFTLRSAVLALAMTVLAGVANAQVTIEMANIRCEQYLAMPVNQSREFSAWMSGWFSYKLGKTWVDLVAFEKNIKNVQAWCKYHPKETVMSGLQNATSPK
jgi:hypothetical protein